MISTSDNPSDRDEIIRLVDHVLQTDPQAKPFELRVLRDHVEPHSYGWSIPVASGTMCGSAYDLARAIEHAQELAEQETSQELSLFLGLFDE